MRITIEIRSVYGENKAYPLCPAGTCRYATLKILKAALGQVDIAKEK